MSFFKGVSLYTGLLALAAAFGSPQLSAEPYLPWSREGFAINQPLGELQGNADRGRHIVIDRSKGNCLACHQLPIPEEEFHGTLGPALNGIATRLSEGEIRLRVVDEKQINPASVMPGFYRNPQFFNQVLEEYAGRTVLTAQEVEDVVAYLLTLKGTEQ
jgi:sulfur-oxidizing protein SoxX